MAECGLSQDESMYGKMYPVWNPEIPVQYDEHGKKIFGFCLQNPLLFKFKHIKLLSLYSVNFGLPNLDSYDVYKYCNGNNSINDICQDLQSSNPSISEKQVIEHIKKLENMGLLIIVSS